MEWLEIGALFLRVAVIEEHVSELNRVLVHVDHVPQIFRHPWLALGAPSAKHVKISSRAPVQPERAPMRVGARHPSRAATTKNRGRRRAGIRLVRAASRR